MADRWPIPRGMCLDCRTATASEAPCPNGEPHQVRSLETAEGREALMTTVWGPPSRRRRAKQLASSAGGGGSVGGFLEGCGGCGELGSLEGTVGAVVLAIVVAGLAVLLLYWLTTKIVAAVRRRQNRPRALGAEIPAKLPRSSHAIGAVTATGPTREAPIGDERCVGFALELRKGQKVMFRAGATDGFEVELDSGDRVRVPGGPLAIDLHGSPLVKRALEPDELAMIDPASELADLELDPLTHDRYRIRLLRPGDRVEILGALEPIPGDGETGYREASTVLVPTERPAVRLGPH